VKSLTGREFARLVEGKGWSLLRIQGSHHVYGKTGNPARLSVTIHGSKPLKTGLQRHLLKLASIDPETLR
jgi:predicted RNA binding protein YcfA (HicA-like mRNA interferase family)